MRLFAALLLTSALAAQSPVVLPFHCTDEDMQWAGMTCSEQEPCPIYLEVSMISGSGNHVFLTGNLHSATTTLYSVLLASEDGGRTWTEAFERLRGVTLDQLQVLDDKNAWAGGQLMVPVPSDPFLLITGDGGKTWRKRPVLEEGSHAVLQNLRFGTPLHGQLLLDRGGSGNRYELYETDSSGDSWNIRRKLDHIGSDLSFGPADPGWRVRIDARTQTFHIEKHQGDGWAGAGVLPVRAGECKPEIPKETPADEKPPVL